jgi:hypothetical protein
MEALTKEIQMKLEAVFANIEEDDGDSDSDYDDEDEDDDNSDYDENIDNEDGGK